jgi:2'-5' RNA ligase
VKLFVAVNLPALERRAIWESIAPLRSSGAPVRWAAEPDLHITLRYMGEVADAQAEPIGAALVASVRGVKPFDLGLGGAGAFPDFAAPRLLWIGVERHPALELLANDVEGALRPFGFEPELRPFQPHLTVGRAKRDAESEALGDLGRIAASLDYAGVIPVEALDLMVSRPGSGVPRYQSLHRAVLGGGR